MKATEFKALREHIGYSTVDLAKEWGLSSPKIIIAWSNGKEPIPPKRATQLRQMVNEFNLAKQRLARTHGHTYIIPNDDKPASWHRALAINAKKTPTTPLELPT